ncbi:hypothetical protein Tco_1077443, partial [Tanacetum coccineum]
VIAMILNENQGMEDDDDNAYVISLDMRAVRNAFGSCEEGKVLVNYDLDARTSYRAHIKAEPHVSNGLLMNVLKCQVSCNVNVK